MSNPIRLLNPEKLVASLSMLIQGLADSYGARHQLTDFQLTESIDMIESKYSHLGLEEIVTAYRMAFSDRLDLSSKEMEMYGKYSVAQLSKVLNAYCRYRRKIHAAMIEEKHKKSLETRNEQRKVKALEVLENEMKNLHGSVSKWQDVKPYWYDAAKKRKLMPRDEALIQSCWNQALGIAKLELEKEKTMAKNQIERMKVASLLNSEKSIEERAKPIAQKIYLFETCIKTKKNA